MFQNVYVDNYTLKFQQINKSNHPFEPIIPLFQHSNWGVAPKFYP